MPRGCKRAKAKAEKARESLVDIITAISNLEPTMGAKWQAGMLDYYFDRLAELVLYQSGFRHSGREARDVVKAQLKDILAIHSQSE